MGADESSRERLGATARRLRIDALTVEVVLAFEEAGTRPILLKGASTARWLYAEFHERSYVDCDLLVAPTQRAAAERVLRELGFDIALGDDDTPGWRQPAHKWVRADDAAHVDLHRTLAGLRVSDAEAWTVLSRDTETIVVGAAEVAVLATPLRALHLALHAAQHGAKARKPLADLERALARTSLAVWQQAAKFAQELGAAASLASGLSLVPSGAAMAERLGLSGRVPVDVALSATTPPPLAMGFEDLMNTPGVVGKTQLLVRKLVPTPRFMREWLAVARRGPLGLAFAYLWRPLWLVLHAPPGFLAWWRAARSR